MKSLKYIIIISFIFTCTVAFAATHYVILMGDRYEGGYGAKTYKECSDGYYATALYNRDYGKNNQAVNRFLCKKLSDIISGYEDIDYTHGSTHDIYPQWYGGKGPKPPAFCSNGSYIVGMQNFDWGSNNQSLYRARCSEPNGFFPSHTETRSVTREFVGGVGEKGIISCPTGYVMTGLANKDYGKNNQTVYRIYCAKPEIY